MRQVYLVLSLVSAQYCLLSALFRVLTDNQTSCFGSFDGLFQFASLMCALCAVLTGFTSVQPHMFYLQGLLHGRFTHLCGTQHVYNDGPPPIVRRSHVLV